MDFLNSLLQGASKFGGGLMDSIGSIFGGGGDSLGKFPVGKALDAGKGDGGGGIMGFLNKYMTKDNLFGSEKSLGLLTGGAKMLGDLGGLKGNLESIKLGKQQIRTQTDLANENMRQQVDSSNKYQQGQYMADNPNATMEDMNKYMATYGKTFNALK